MITCTQCQSENAPGNRFCLQCGAVLAPQPTCRACGHALATTARFCTQCGQVVAPEPEVPEGPGYVVDGEWHRAPGEFVRKVPVAQMRSAFARLLPGVDLDAYLRGTLVGRILDKLQARSIRVPAGSVGVVMMDGVCQRILPPGEQTTVGWLKDLVRLVQGDVKGALSATADRLLEADRVSFYLVDRRPIPIRSVLEVPTGDGALTTLQVQALIRTGADRDALGTFIDGVVGDRETLSTEALHVEYGAEVERAARDAIRARPGDLPAAEKEVERSLRARLTARTGLRFDVVLAPRHTLHRLDLRLGDVGAPEARPCSACDQPVRPGQRFCTHCGASQPDRAEAPGEGALFTRDGVQVELDLVLSVQGEGEVSPSREVLLGTAARYLRDRGWDEVVGAEGFTDLEAGMSEAAGGACRALGQRLIALDLVDLRSADGQWELGARAAMERSRQEAVLGREWLDVRGEEVELEQLTLAMALREQQVHRDHAFAERRARLEQARRVADLEDGERELAERRRAAEHDQSVAEAARRRELEVDEVGHREELERRRRQAVSEGRRLEVDDETYADRARREARLVELRAMASLEAEVSDREHQQHMEAIGRMEGRTEAEILALQATQLADAEHGADFAKALASLADGEAAQRERERADARHDAQDERMMRLMEAAVGVAGQRQAEVRDAYRDAAQEAAKTARTAMEAHAEVAAARATRTTVCGQCGADLPDGARFCGECGSGA